MSSSFWIVFLSSDKETKTLTTPDTLNEKRREGGWTWDGDGGSSRNGRRGLTLLGLQWGGVQYEETLPGK